MVLIGCYVTVLKFHLFIVCVVVGTRVEGRGQFVGFLSSTVLGDGAEVLSLGNNRPYSGSHPLVRDDEVCTVYC